MKIQRRDLRLLAFMQKKPEGQWRATLWKTELMIQIHCWNLI